MYREEERSLTVYPTPIVTFRDTERWFYSDMDQNLFAIAISQADRFYEFLRIIKARLDAARGPFVELNLRLQQHDAPGIRAVTVEEALALQQSGALGATIELDIESFYVFAKITLDKIAHFLERYFGPERGCTLGSHDKLVTFFARYRDAKGLSVPEDFMGQAKSLAETVSLFRDKQIEHQRSPRRLVGLAWTGDGDLRLAPTHVNPKVGDRPQTSAPLGPIPNDLDRYLQSVFEMVRTNRDKGTFPVWDRRGKP